MFLKGNPQADVYIGELDLERTYLKPPRRLTMDLHWDMPYAWTPDSKAVLFVSDRTGSFNIFKQALDEDTAEPAPMLVEYNSGVSALLNGEAPHFSPEGDWILYSEASKKEEADLRTASRRLMRIPATGGQSQFVLEAQGFFKHCCARAPATLCVLGEMDEKRNQLKFTAFDPEKGRGHELARVNVRLQPGIVAWDLSPDASRIAYSDYDVQEGRIHFISLDGGTIPDLVVRGWYGFTALTWASDSKGIFVTSIEANATRILYIDPHGQAHPISEQKPFLASWCVPSPDGRYLAIMTPDWDSNVWTLENFL